MDCKSNFLPSEPICNASEIRDLNEPHSALAAAQVQVSPLFRTPSRPGDTATIETMAPAFAHALPVGSTAVHGSTVCATRPARSATGVRMAFTSIGGVLTEAPVSTPCDMDVALRAAYRQVLGNAYLMDSERAELKDAESAFMMTSNAKEFVRAIACSSAYRSRFFDAVSAYRFIELAFKHLLGRGCRSLAEYGEVMGVLQKSGYEAAISWFVDSMEYEETFGYFTIPYPVYRGLYPTNEEFNRARALEGTPSSSDKARSSVLQYAVCSGDSPSWLSITKGLPAGTEKGTGFTVGGHWTSSQRNKRTTKRVGTKIPGGVVFN